MIMKPSEQDPGACLLLAKLVKEAGIPDGCFNIIHGQHDAVNFICDHPEIRAISFVGGDRAVFLIPLLIRNQSCKDGLINIMGLHLGKLFQTLMVYDRS